MPDISVEIWARPVSDDLVTAFERMTPQLSRSNPPPSAERLQQIVDAAATDLFVATDEAGTIVGTSTLVSFRIPTALRAWIEDVVVDESARGAGIGAALTAAMVDRARDLGAATVDLTSRPTREAANRLYLRAGFEVRDTSVYRYDVHRHHG